MKIRENNWKKAAAGSIAVLVLAVACLFSDINVNAENMKIGTVVGIYEGSSLNVRDNPGTTNTKIIGFLKNGQTGEILEERNVNGTVWYRMNVSGMVGWVSSAYIQVMERNTDDFDAYLTAQGFPESYKAQLMALHMQYPNWIFEAQQTNLNWNDVIAAESALGKNLVHTSSISSWKSTQNGAYNWETGEWTVFDSGGWVMASKEMIQYCMDPRNFLDSNNIFQFIKQSYDVNALSSEQIAQKKKDLTNMVSGTYLAGNCDGRSYVDVIMDIAAETKVCPLTLASMMIQEQGRNGEGGCISGTVPGYEGYYNYFNIGAYREGSMDAVQRGLWYASGRSGYTTYGRPWNTREKSIRGGALYYGSNYVNVGQDTMYLKKFNVQGSDIYNHQYMTNVQGAISEGQHVAAGYDENARKSALIFKIPVYQNMPEKACAKPTGNDNPNYMLKSLTVSGQTLTPTFSIYETSYSVIVPYNVSGITISAEAIASTTSVSGTGNKSLNVGTNLFQITTKAQNGSVRTYTINVVRQAEGSQGGTDNQESAPRVESTNYNVNSNNTITGIADFPISAADFAQKFSVTNGNIKITTSNGTVKTGNVGTGDQVRVYDRNGTLKFTYNVIIYGDVNGDGRINAQDLLMIQKNNIHVKTLDGVYFAAADTNRNGKVNAQDLLIVQKHNIRIASIQQ